MPMKDKPPLNFTKISSAAPKETLMKALSENLRDRDERSLAIDLVSGMDAEELSKLEAEVPGPLPKRIRELLSFASGFEFGPVGNLSFAGVAAGQFVGFLHGLALVVDGYGNSWNVDIKRTTGEWGPVFFVSHDPPVVVLQAAAIEVFMEQVFDIGRHHHLDALTYIRKEGVHRIWDDDPFLVPVTNLLDLRDKTLANFAAELSHDFRIADLRKAEFGSGFTWGLSGPNTIVKRAGDELVFAVQWKTGLLDRLLGRRR